MTSRAADAPVLTRDAGTLHDERRTATFPFGAPLRSLVQEDRRRKRVFVLGVYASAVHARWIGGDGKQLVRALAVASEPRIFWDGTGAKEIVARISLPAGAGSLEAADEQFNGPSGKALDREYLEPLGLSRADAWLCDLVPHACLNPSQEKAIAGAYERQRRRWGLPAVTLPPVPTEFADHARRAEINAEVKEADPDVIVLLGDQPIKHWLRYEQPRWRRLIDFGQTTDSYGRLRSVVVGGRERQVLAVAHPRQVSGLGSYSVKWQQLHRAWRASVAADLLRR